MEVRRCLDKEGNQCIRYKVEHDYNRAEMFSLLVHENLALIADDIRSDGEYDYYTFRDFTSIDPDQLTDDDRYDIMCQFHNLFAFLECNGYQVTDLDLCDVTLLKHSDPGKNNHILVHKLDVTKPRFRRACNDYMIGRCAKMLGNSKIRGELKPCRVMKQGYILKNSRYIERVNKFRD